MDDSLKFKIGDRVVCRRLLSEYVNLVGTVTQLPDEFTNYSVELDTCPFKHESGIITWEFYEEEMRKLTKLEKALK